MLAGGSASAFVTGLTLTATLIVAIGAQNAFVLRQGLKREHVCAVVAFCICADAILLSLGVAGMGRMLSDSAWTSLTLSLAGAAFLIGYAIRAFKNAAAPQAGALVLGPSSLSLRAALTQLAAFTFLNPHVYIDTVLLIGTVGAEHPEHARAWFVGGALAASATWFCALGFGARWLTPIFSRPRAWRILDAAVGVMMLTLGTSLGLQGLRTISAVSISA